MDFGLGLVLNLTDNATAGINNAVQSLNQLTSVAESASSSLNQMASLSAFSVVTDKMGNAFLGAGNKVLGVITNLLGNVKNVGSDFEGFRMTLNALYGDSVEAEKQIGKLLDFSVKSPFEVNDVKDMLVVLKSQGIDAFEQMTGAASNFQQENLAWLGDLMAFKPDIPMQRWKLAITNFLGSGQAKVLENALDMGKVPEILGHAMGTTAEERMQDLIEIVDKKGLSGLAEKLSFTWQGVASNISDAMTKIYKSIADNEVFDKLKMSFMGLSGAILSMEDSDLEAFGKTVAEGLNLILDPVTKVVSKINDLMNAFVDLAKTNPDVIKFGVAAISVAGLLLTAVGIALKVASAFSGVSLMMIASGNQMSSIGGLLKSGLGSVMSNILPLIAVVGLLALAWKTDFAGIQTNTIEFIKGITESFKTAKDMVGGSVEDMIKTIETLQNKGDFFSNITLGIAKVMTVFKALSEGWNDFTISDDTFQKAEALGIIPLIERLFDLKYRFDAFKKGFIEGFTELGDKIKTAFDKIKNAVKGTFIEDALKGLEKILTAITSGDISLWEDFGKKIGQFAPVLIVLIPLFRMFSKFIGGIPKVLGGFTKSGSDVAKTGSKFEKASESIMKIGVAALMIGGAFFLLAKASTMVAESGGGAIAVFVVMSAALVGLVALLGVFGPKIKESASGLLAIGAAALMIAGAFALMSYAAIQLSESGMGASVMFGVMLVGLIALVAVVGAFGTKLTEGAVGLAILGAGLLLVAGAMMMMASAATSMSSAGTGAYVALAVLVGVVTAIAVASSVFAAQLLVGAVALGAFGVALAIVAADMLMLSASIAIVTGCLPDIAEYGGQAAISTAELGASLLVMSAGAAAIAVSGVAGAAGLVALAGGLTAMRLAMGDVGNDMEKIGNAVKNINTYSSSASTSLLNFTKMGSASFNQMNTVIENSGTAFTTLTNTVVTNSANMVSAFSKAVSQILAQIQVLKNSMNFSWSLPPLKMPHFKVSGKFSADPPSVPEYSVDWYAKGGVIDNPSIIGVGEAGAEAVMPLENNTEWIGTLAKMLHQEMNVVEPTNTVTPTGGGSISPSTPVATPSAPNNTSTNNNDNSVNFASGSIVVNVQNASEEEARNLAQKIMDLIKRQKEIDGMTSYGYS